MDAEDEPTSYLKYLNDSDTPNTYLLENNEVGLFSVEPIFTEMEASDWPQEGFPLLLTNSLITEDATEDQDTTSSQSSDRNIVNETLHQNNVSETAETNNLQGTIEDSIENKSIEVQNVIEIQPGQNDVPLEENQLQASENNVQFNPVQVRLQSSNRQINENCVKLENNMHQDGNLLQVCGIDLLPHENSSQEGNSVLNVNENQVVLDENVQVHENNVVFKLKPNEKYIILNKNSLHGENRILKCIPTDKPPLQARNTVLKSINSPLTQKEQSVTQKQSKNVDDLLSTVIAHKCKVCGLLHEDLERIKKHIGENHSEFLFTHSTISSGESVLVSNVKKKNEQNNEGRCLVYVCSECRAVCTNMDNLRQHMIEVHNLTTEEEIVSNTVVQANTGQTQPVLKKTGYLSDVTIGLVKKQERDMQKIKCNVSRCAASFPNEELCETHTRLHIGDTRTHFKCAKCKETFQLWRIARSHMYKDHGMDFGMIVCPMCGVFKSYRAAKILKHMLTHTDQKPFLCQECGTSFKQLSQLKNHEMLHKQPEDMPTWSNIKKCEKCHRFFANPKSLKAHIQAVHENFKPFICNICGHKSSRKAMLELHMRQHTGSKPYECSHCSYKTADPSCLRRHAMKHLGSVAYQCPYCPYRCIQSASIRSHLQNKHKGKSGLFSCKYCSYTTINETCLQAHQRNHETASMEAASSASTGANERERIETDLQTDEETQSCFLNTESQIEETVDNGGITIPAGLEMQLVS